jgi:uncharacterized protein with GYD domain
VRGRVANEPEADTPRILPSLEEAVPKYLVMGTYAPDGLRGMLKDGGSKRRQAAEAALSSAGARLEAFYFAFGKHDLYAIVDAPDNVAIAAATTAISASGAVRTETVVLLTPEEVDQVTKRGALYSPPGR